MEERLRLGLEKLGAAGYWGFIFHTEHQIVQTGRYNSFQGTIVVAQYRQLHVIIGLSSSRFVHLTLDR